MASTENRQALLEETFQEAERAGLRFAIKGRLVALVLLGLWFVLTRSGDPERALAFAAAMAGFGLLGLLHYRLIGSRFERPWQKYAFVAVDFAVLSFLIGTQPILDTVYLPQVMMFRNGGLFPIWFVILAVAAFSFSPGLLLWAGAVGAAGWLGAFYWSIRDMAVTLDWGDIGPQPTTEHFLAVFFDPNFIATGSRVQEALTFLVVAILIAAVMWRARRTVRRQLELSEERRSLTDLFGQYVPRAVADSLIDAQSTSGRGLLEPVDRTATVLFIDIAGFTAMTESAGPRRVVTVLNEFFDCATEAITARNGVVTQFIGDAIMATFNLPVEDGRHPGNAVLAALDILTLAESGRFDGERLRIRAGVCTGPAIGGSVGGGGRQSYSVYGDTVNLAARLEALNKDYGTELLVAAPTAALLEDAPLREIGRVPVRGFSEPVAIYTTTPETRAALARAPEPIPR